MAGQKLLLLGVLSITILPPAVAQTPEAFTLRPHEMATATRTERVGEFQLDSFPDYVGYVPQQCVGERRCPLVVFLPGGGQAASFAIKWQRIMADKHGIIVLVLSWVPRYQVAKIDAAMKEVLRTYAIDPAKIALIGRCAGGPPAVALGGANMDIFSRILPISGPPRTARVQAPNGTTEFFLDAGLWESKGNFRVARELREAGHRVKLIVGLRGHDENIDDYDFVGRWLQMSWAIPDSAVRPAPYVIPGPTPRLTLQMVKQMTTFWTRFMQEPYAIRMKLRRAHQREVVVPVGGERPSVVMMDMAAMASAAPSVAGALTEAGLTAAQHDAYRVAMISAMLTREVGVAVEATSVVAQNIEFMQAHPDAFEALSLAGSQRPDLIGIDSLNPMSAEIQARSRKLIGIWEVP